MKKLKNYGELIEKLEEFSKKWPKMTTSKMNQIVEELEAYDEIKSGRFLKNIDKIKLAIGIMIFLIFIAGFLNFDVELIASYFGGFVFFISGIFIGLYISKFGLIFLFSHGCTGLALMTIPIVSMALTSPIVTDGSNQLLFVYIGLLVILFLFGTISSVIYNFSTNIQKIRKSQLIPWGFYTATILLAVLFPKLLPLLCR